MSLQSLSFLGIVDWIWPRLSQQNSEFEYCFLGNRYQAYGVIGGVLVLTLWVWLVGVILYFGQCLSVELAAVRLAKHGSGNRTT